MILTIEFDPCLLDFSDWLPERIKETPQPEAHPKAHQLIGYLDTYEYLTLVVKLHSDLPRNIVGEEIGLVSAL